MRFQRLLLPVICVLILAPGTLYAQTEDNRFFLNSLKKFGGDYPTDNANTSNSILLGRDNEETFQIFRQNSGDQSTFCGGSSWNDCYVFLQTDANGNDPDGAVLFGGVGQDDTFEPHLMIDGSSKIGVGTTHPHEKLSVAGNVLAEEVIVKSQSNWSDYVFEPDYDLPSLEQVSSFIEKKGHLPDVPSAASVEQNGLRLGEMDATLLRKVEELTLYTIEQKKRADHQASTIDSLRRANARLRRETESHQNQVNKLRSRLETERRRNDRQATRIQKLEAQLQQLLRSETTQ